MSTHTPGPWKALGGGNSIGVYTAMEENTPIHQPLHIASCWRSAAVDGYANGRLIAAAPDMHAALKAIMAGFESGVLCRNTDHDGGSDWAIKAMPALAALAAGARAIEKAEGQA